MKERINQLKARYQSYSARERNLLNLSAAALCCAALYYGGIVPLDTMIRNSQSVLNRQTETLNWIREEIKVNHLQVKKVKVSSPRNVIEVSAKEVNINLSNVRQDGQSLSFSVENTDIKDLTNWLRELNFVSGVRLEKMNLTPVDRLNVVKADVVLTWRKV